MCQAIFNRIWIHEDGTVTTEFTDIYKNIVGPIERDLINQNIKSASAETDADFIDKLLKSYSNFFGQGLNNELLEGEVKIDIFIFETVRRNTAQRPFWTARRVARKFPACGRELRTAPAGAFRSATAAKRRHLVRRWGGSTDPEHLNAEGWSRPSGGGTQNERHLLSADVFRFGPSGETRTPGILLPKQARYQLRYTRIWNFPTVVKYGVNAGF